jgi:hypothetical protein
VSKGYETEDDCELCKGQRKRNVDILVNIEK